MAVVPIQLNGCFCMACRIAGPCCGALLADMGATVIKVEPPTGDSMRYVQRQPQDAAGNSQQVRTAPIQTADHSHAKLLDSLGKRSHGPLYQSMTVTREQMSYFIYQRLYIMYCLPDGLSRFFLYSTTIMSNKR